MPKELPELKPNSPRCLSQKLYFAVLKYMFCKTSKGCSYFLVNTSALLLLLNFVVVPVIESVGRSTSKNFALSLNDLIQLNHVWMPHFLKYLDLTADSLNVFLVFNS